MPSALPVPPERLSLSLRIKVQAHPHPTVNHQPHPQNMITLECNYSKKIGLPGYSSHQFSITLRTEISDLSQVQPESARLYALLQNGVDSSIKEIGFLPANEVNGSSTARTNGNSNTNGNGHSDSWNCSDKQRDLILKIVEENKLDKNQIETLAKERFSLGVKALNKLQASGLFDELLEKYGDKKPSNRRFNRQGAQR